MLNKKEFINGYMFLYGGTKKNAMKKYEDAIENNEHEWIYTIIQLWRNQCKLAFYND